jgi:hypothetical protein
VLLLLVLQIWEVANNKELFLDNKFLIRFSVISLLVIFLRNNGIFIIFITFLVLAIVIRKKLAKKIFWKKIIPTFAGVIIVSILIQGPLFSALHIGPSPISESVGIPLGQIEAVVANDGTLSDKDKSVIEQIAPLENWKADYAPKSVDLLKFDPAFDNNWFYNNTGTFFATYLSIGQKNISTYISQYLSQTGSLWNPLEMGYYSKYNHVQMNELNLYSVDQIGVAPFLDSLFSVQIFRIILFNTGALIWYLFALVALFIYRKQKHLILPLVPLLTLWGTNMIAIPANVARYQLPIFLALPLLIFILTKSKNKRFTP